MRKLSEDSSRQTPYSEDSSRIGNAPLRRIRRGDEQHEHREREDDRLAGRGGRIHREMPGKRRIVVASIQRTATSPPPGERHGATSDTGSGTRGRSRAISRQRSTTMPASSRCSGQHGSDDRGPVHRALSVDAGARWRAEGARQGRDGRLPAGRERDRVPSARCSTNCWYWIAASSVVFIGPSGNRPRAKTATTIAARIAFSRKLEIGERLVRRLRHAEQELLREPQHVERAEHDAGHGARAREHSG